LCFEFGTPLAPESSETPLANETVTISATDETVGITTGQAGKFKMPLWKRDGSYSISGGGRKKDMASAEITAPDNFYLIMKE